MSYTFYSFHSPDDHNSTQWADRSVEGEIQSCSGRTLERIFSEFLQKTPAKILEAGCGLCGWVYYLKNKGHDIIGIEYDSQIVDKVKAYDSSAPIQQGDVNVLEFKNDTFDAYISLGVVEHFQEGPMAALQEAYRVLKPGGKGFITVPYLSIMRRLFSHPLRDIYFYLYHVLKKGDTYFWEYRYSKKEMIRFVEETGFEVTHIDIDDYELSNFQNHIGLYADFFFLRKRNSKIWELNWIGKMILLLGKIFSPWTFCSGIHLIVQKPNRK